MILPLLKKVAADSNVILSAVIGKAALNVFASGDFTIITTEFNCEEVKEYLPVLSKKYHLDIQAVLFQFEMLPIVVYPLRYYQEAMPNALKILKDPDDAHLLALSMKENVPVWSNDEHFRHKTIARYTTAELLKLLSQ